MVPPVIPIYRPTGILLSINNPSSSRYPNYTPYSYKWNATGPSALLAFSFRHDPGYWQLDDVTVYSGVKQLIQNGGFEIGDLTGWGYSGNCNSDAGRPYQSGRSSKAGNWYYNDGCRNGVDTISQTFPTVAGYTYIISFWLRNQDCCRTVETVTVTIT